jgi:hypothetical protein
VLESTPTPEGPCAGDLDQRNARFGLTITPDTIQSQWLGNPLDVEWTVSGLCYERERRRGSNN